MYMLGVCRKVTPYANVMKLGTVGLIGYVIALTAVGPHRLTGFGVSRHPSWVPAIDKAHRAYYSCSRYRGKRNDYCSPVWSPVYKADITKLEAVQRRFTRRLKQCAGFSYAARLKFLNAETLELRRLKQDLVTIYKMFHGLMDVRVNEFFQVQTANITRGHNYKIIKPVCNNNARQFSFSCRRINCWNSLTQTIVNAHSVAAFKHYLNSVNFSKYLYVLN